MSVVSEWYEKAALREQTVSDEVLKKRLKAAKIIHDSSIESGLDVTQEMIDDELLLITGRMDREEFNDYISFKKSKGGWQ